MTSTEYNMAIAQECFPDWQWTLAFGKIRGSKTVQLGQPGTDGSCTDYRGCPDYYHDLNACAEMETALDPKDRPLYQHHLDRVCSSSKDPHCSCWDFIHAAAPQRCEAFLRVRGKLKE